MKNLSLYLNIILFLLVGYLYMDKFKSTPSTEVAPIVPPAGMDRGAKIAYVNTDTLFEKYQWYKDQKAALEQKVKNAENSMKQEVTAYQRDAASFAQKQESGNYPPAELEKEYNALMEKQQRLAQKEQNLSEKLGKEQEEASKQLLVDIETQLKAIQGKIGYDYILSYARGGGQVWLTNDSLDITQQVVDLLNASKKQ